LRTSGICQSFAVEERLADVFAVDIAVGVGGELAAKKLERAVGQPLGMLLVGDDDHDIDVRGGRGEAMRDRAAQQERADVGLGLEVGDRALDGGLVVWVHGRGAPVGLCARHADKEPGDRLLKARQERRTQ